MQFIRQGRCQCLLHSACVPSCIANKILAEKYLCCGNKQMSEEMLKQQMQHRQEKNHSNKLDRRWCTECDFMLGRTAEIQTKRITWELVLLPFSSLHFIHIFISCEFFFLRACICDAFLLLCSFSPVFSSFSHFFFDSLRLSQTHAKFLWIWLFESISILFTLIVVNEYNIETKRARNGKEKLTADQECEQKKNNQ